MTTQAEKQDQLGRLKHVLCRADATLEMRNDRRGWKIEETTRQAEKGREMTKQAEKIQPNQ